MKTEFILNALIYKYTDRRLQANAKRAPQYSYFEELRIGTGHGKNKAQRIDFFVIDHYDGLLKTAFEIKVSRSDFKAELNKPFKKRAAMMFANEFYFITPEKLIKKSEVPMYCGLIEVTEKGFLREVVHAPHLDDCMPTWLFISSICRRVFKLENKRG